jgi:hypothetical protein
MNVSLCGPHSLETSTLPATDADAPPFVEGRAGEFASRYWYFAHHVGL